MYRQGCRLLHEAAQRAASKRATKISLSTNFSENDRGDQRFSIRSFSGLLTTAGFRSVILASMEFYLNDEYGRDEFLARGKMKKKSAV